MSQIIAEFGGRYLVWSESSDRPITTLMTLPELRQFVVLEYGYDGLRELSQRLERVTQYGTSSRMGITKKSLLERNCAGPQGETVGTEEEMVALYGGQTVEHWTPSIPLDPSKPIELQDAAGLQPVKIVVTEVLGVRNGAVFATIQLPDVPEPTPVLIRLEDGKVMNEGFKYMYAVNVEVPATCPAN